MKRTHTYTCAKGYADQYKTREVKWDVYTTPDEAIAAGQFDSIETIMQYANAQLNIRKGHAIQDATQEQVKGEDGKPTGKLVRPSMSLKDMEDLAASTVAKKIERAEKGSGGVKKLAAQAQTTKTKAQAMLSSDSLTEGKLAALLELEQIDQATYDAKLAELKAKKGKAPAK